VVIPEAETGGAMRPGMKVLDVGAGTGGAVLAFRQAGHEAWGVEPSARAVEVAHEQGNRWVLHGSLDALLHDDGLPDGPWDVIRMSQVLEHVPDPLATLGEIRALLAPGGRLIVGVPNIRSLAARATRGSWDGLEMPRHLVHYDRDSLTWVLALAGFRVASMRTTPLMGVLAGSVDARTTGGDRQRGWGDLLPVRLLAYPLEWGLGVVGQGDGLLAVARPAAA
jgi:SAM-dependent methyltransferase